jgi:two-component system, OmpR family, response regulator ResD
MKQTILVVEDEPKLRELISDYLVDEDYNVLQAENGVVAIGMLEKVSVDLIIIDIMMPLKDGYSVVKSIRKNFSMPVIFLTALSSEDNRLKGYDVGADDYMTKPFSPKLLVAKVKALLKRWESQISENEKPVQIGKLLVDKLKHKVILLDNEIVLTPREYSLLMYMISNMGQVLNREQMISKVWGIDYDGGDRTVDIHITRLREKLHGSEVSIETIRKVGYRLEVVR